MRKKRLVPDWFGMGTVFRVSEKFIGINDSWSTWKVKARCFENIIIIRSLVQSNSHKFFRTREGVSAAKFGLLLQTKSNKLVF
jgi:hypothetical protein